MNALEQIREAGIVGCGGAGFPTHVKYNTKVKWFIINAAECEPLLRTDRYLMLTHAEHLIDAAETIGRLLSAEQIVIATKETYKKEIDSIRQAINRHGGNIKLHLMESFYPAGDEQVIVYEVTGQIVPPGNIPSAVSAVVSNVGTVYQVWEALQDRPFIHKYLTVTGAVNRPVIIKTPIGTSIKECIDAAIPLSEDYDVIIGGPMMGKKISNDNVKDTPVTKTTSGLIVLPKETSLMMKAKMPISHMLHRAKSACVQCTFCTELCSRHLLGHPLRPHMIMRKLALSKNTGSLLEDEDIRQAMICSECGICEEYACPMGLQPRSVNAMLKRVLREENIKYVNERDSFDANEMREFRKTPSERLAARLGLTHYYHLDITDCLEITPDAVCIPCTQHVGKPSTPVVRQGEYVQVGQLIAQCDAGALGANIHASISGTVKIIGNNIEINGKNMI